MSSINFFINAPIKKVIFKFKLNLFTSPIIKSEKLIYIKLENLFIFYINPVYFWKYDPGIIYVDANVKNR